MDSYGGKNQSGLQVIFFYISEAVSDKKKSEIRTLEIRSISNNTLLMRKYHFGNFLKFFSITNLIIRSTALGKTEDNLKRQRMQGKISYHCKALLKLQEIILFFEEGKRVEISVFKRSYFLSLSVTAPSVKNVNCRSK